MIAVTGTLICKTQDDVVTVRTCLPTHVRLSRAEPGCLSFNVDPTEDPLVWRLDESFTDQAAFEAHQDRTRASAWYEATRHLTRHFTVTET